MNALEHKNFFPKIIIYVKDLEQITKVAAILFIATTHQTLLSSLKSKPIL